MEVLHAFISSLESLSDNNTYRVLSEERVQFRSHLTECHISLDSYIICVCVCVLSSILKIFVLNLLDFWI